jgi:hypothetical protein
MFSVPTSSAVDCGFKPRFNLIISIYYFSTALRKKSKDWLAHNRDNVSELSDRSTHGLLFQWASTMKKYN